MFDCTKTLNINSISNIPNSISSSILFTKENFRIIQCELYNNEEYLDEAKKLTKDNQQPSIYDDDYHMNEGSTTIPNGSTSQANGDGNALPTNSGEDIV